jgi:hypothetical protein
MAGWHSRSRTSGPIGLTGLADSIESPDHRALVIAKLSQLGAPQLLSNAAVRIANRR